MTDTGGGTPLELEDKIDRLEELLTGSEFLPKFLAAIGLQVPLIAAVSFGFGLIVKFVGLSEKIRRATEESEANLRGLVLAQGIFRPPIAVSSPTQKMLLYFSRLNGEAKRLYPKAYKQLEPTIATVARGGEGKLIGLRRLRAALCILPIVYEAKTDTSEDMLRSDYVVELRRAVESAEGAGEFERIILDVGFEELANRGSVDFVALCDLMYPFVKGEVFSDSSLRNLLPSYSRAQLRQLNLAITAAENTELSRLKKTIDDLVWETVLGSDGAIERTLGFVVDREKFLLNEELEKLEEDITDLEATPEDERSEDENNTLEWKREAVENIRKRLEDIAAPLFPEDDDD